MASIFNKTNNLFENPNRNTFDLSFQNNLTLNMGELVPVMCKECLPGDSFKIDPTISLRMMPLLFPVQTRLRAHLHFFYVTNRSLWKDWMDFIGRTKESLELPYVNLIPSTGSLADYLGIPSTVVSGVTKPQNLLWWSGTAQNQVQYGKGVTSDAGSEVVFNLSQSFDIKPAPIIYDSLAIDRDFDLKDFALIFDEINYALGYSGSSPWLTDTPLTDTNNYRLSYDLKYESGHYQPTQFNTVLRNGGLVLHPSVLTPDKSIAFCYYCPNMPSTVYNEAGEELYSYRLLNPLNHLTDEDWSDPNKSVRVAITWVDENGHRRYAHTVFTKQAVEHSGIILTNNKVFEMAAEDNPSQSQRITYGELRKKSSNFSVLVLFEMFSTDCFFDKNAVGFNFGSFISTNDSTTRYETWFKIGDSNAFSDQYLLPSSEPLEVSDTIPEKAYGLKYNALPFRAYEAIYNSFYRDERNNPFMIDGEPVYNKFLKNYDGGNDTDVNTDLYKRNWQSDFLTTAVQSPQQGVAPLVGITARGEISFRDEDTGEIYTAKLNTSNGDAIDSFTVTSPNMPQGHLRQLVDFASSGISISDLRGVNSLQRWLEINMRRGLRYKDQIKSHFGVDVRYDELLMPEFIGGISTDIYVNQINQTAPTAGQPLGWFAGQGGAFESAKHSINHYCQEHGYIIGILSIEPTPQYSQLLPKHFLKSQLLDYYFPEFGHLGMQPILYSEVAPNESLYHDKDLNDTFGYQRAWYDYLASTDEVHGLFRTSLNNFVVQRFFAHRPELSESFLTIDPRTLDSVFAVQSGTDSHKFLGQVYFDIKAKRPIPEYGIPKLEV